MTTRARIDYVMETAMPDQSDTTATSPSASPAHGRVIAWFSSGAASAVMTKLALVDYPDLLVVQCGHGETGRYANRHDGKLIALLWNNLPAILSALSAAEKLEVAKDALGKIAGVRTVVFDGSEPFNNVEIARQALAALEGK